MNRIGLALSGGGFRASLYHLGLVRFLRDAGLLPRVTHVTSVSGGSVLAAHLALNWDRYAGSPGEFDAAAAEVLASSAFPGFFPPLELTAADVGATSGEFDRQAYTDGAVFDNLGVRMFRVLERPLLAAGGLTRDDFFDLPAVFEALRQAAVSAP